MLSCAPFENTRTTHSQREQDKHSRAGVGTLETMPCE